MFHRLSSSSSVCVASASRRSTLIRAIHHAPTLHTAAPTPRAPSRMTVIATYRALHRAIFQTFYTASQYATYDELACDQLAISGVSPGAAYRKEAFSDPSNAAHVAFARKRTGRWLAQLSAKYRSTVNGNSTPAELAQAQKEAEQYLTLLTSNMEHSRFLLEGGWGLRRNQLQQLTNVAHKVGLQMPKESAPLEHVPAGAKHQKARDAILNKHDKFVK